MGIEERRPNIGYYDLLKNKKDIDDYENLKEG
jgi:hypothetical protein